MHIAAIDLDFFPRKAIVCRSRNLAGQLRTGVVAFLAFLLHSPLLAAPGSDTARPQHEYRVIGYVAGWSRLDFSTIDAEKLTHINYAFANVVDGKVVFGDKIDGVALSPTHFEQLRALKQKNPDLKILVSIGGWTWSKNFSDAALTEASRQLFAESAVQLMLDHELDGVDIDWEYPGQLGDNNKFRAVDKQNFTRLLAKTRERLDQASDQQQRVGNDRFLLTIATGADDAYIANTELETAHKSLDFINIMTYDFHHGGTHQAGHHSNLYPSHIPGATTHSVVAAVQRHRDAGVPAEKLVIGLPFYGRRWTGTASANRGLYQEAESVGHIVDYNTLRRECGKEARFEQHWDETAHAPYLHNPETNVVITFDTPRSFREKIDYIRKAGLGGVMFWEYGYDSEEELINVIDQAFHAPLKSEPITE